ncbi:glycosyltransferase family 2 protein [Eubacteriaceae bacterium ES3]|nr:glycosyltransferase family 2 protein [Eubacteriaceae bacterium ES3]
MLVSIIIPVYNMEKYLERCVKSALAQTHQELQIILVDDGSTDDSPAMCDEYAGMDCHINTIHKQNAGLGYARNTGLKMAKGVYVFFLDADDWLPKDAIELLVHSSYNATFDVIRGVHYIQKGTSSQLAKFTFSEGVVNRNGSIAEKERYRQIKTSSTFGYAWGALFKRSFLLKYKLDFDDNRKIFLEDTLFNLKLFANKPKYYVICKPVYYYLIQEVSLSSNSKQGDDERLLLLLKTYTEYLKNIGAEKENLDLIVPLLARHFCFCVAKSLTFENSSFKTVKEVIITFGENSVVSSLLAQKGAIRYLKMISSKAEMLFYAFCLFFLKHKAWGFLAMLFLVLRPFLNQYIKTHLKV